MVAKLEPYEKKITELYSKVVGHSAVFLEGSEHACRIRECNMGNMVADAFVYGFLNHKEKNYTGWTEYPIAISGGGTIRTSFDPSNNRGNMTLGDLVAVLPFENELVALTVSGETLKSVMEHGVSAYDPSEQRLEGRFLQVSGIRVTYDMRRKIGSQVTSLRVRCSECASPKYEDIDLSKNYTIITTDFMSKGGDGYDMLNTCNGNCRQEFGLRPVEVVQSYLHDKGIVTTGLEDRITIRPASSSSPLTLSVLVLIVCQFIRHYL